MSPDNPIPAVATLLIGFASAALLARRFGAPSAQGRYASIDGLRGYLAFFVFLHHSRTWYTYARTGSWDAGPSNLFLHLGHSSVELFFMITGFLFFGKLLSGRQHKIDWTQLYIARFLRLVPVYLFSMALLFLVVASLSHGGVHEPRGELLKGIAHWLAFTARDQPDLNGVHDTYTIDAGVSWSLPYEWLFYFCLPALALLVNVAAPRRYLALGLYGVVGMALWSTRACYPLAFGAGMAAACLVREPAFCRLASRPSSSWVVLGAITFAIAGFHNTHSLGVLPFLTLAFCLVAGGNTLFGVLVAPVSRFMGELAYSIYLLHGLALFVVFTFVVGRGQAALLPVQSYWMWVAGITPLLVLSCYLTFRFIESPAMRSSKPVASWLRRRFTQTGT